MWTGIVFLCYCQMIDKCNEVTSRLLSNKMYQSASRITALKIFFTMNVTCNELLRPVGDQIIQCGSAAENERERKREWSTG